MMSTLGLFDGLCLYPVHISVTERNVDTTRDFDQALRPGIKEDSLRHATKMIFGVGSNRPYRLISLIKGRDSPSPSIDL
jgi:hypothetical protein